MPDVLRDDRQVGDDPAVTGAVAPHLVLEPAEVDGVDRVTGRALVPVLGPDHELVGEVRDRPRCRTRSSRCSRRSADRSPANRADVIMRQRDVVVVAVHVRIGLHREVGVVGRVGDQEPVVVVAGGDDGVAARGVVPVVVVDQVQAAVGFVEPPRFAFVDSHAAGAATAGHGRRRGGRPPVVVVDSVARSRGRRRGGHVLVLWQLFGLASAGTPKRDHAGNEEARRNQGRSPGPPAHRSSSSSCSMNTTFTNSSRGFTVGGLGQEVERGLALALGQLARVDPLGDLDHRVEVDGPAGGGAHREHLGARHRAPQHEATLRRGWRTR